jgi:hypothetical protein
MYFPESRKYVGILMTDDPKTEEQKRKILAETKREREVSSRAIICSR